METDSRYENPSELGAGDSSGDEERLRRQPHHSDEAIKVLEKSRKPSRKNAGKEYRIESSQQRSERLQCHYNDQYVVLLNESALGRITAAGDSLDSTQIGFTYWSAPEKEQFFFALSKKSKADARGIAASIESKSELEVYEYLRLLAEADRNERLYGREAPNSTPAEIPAAAELSTKCEALLEQAADALASYQDRFDHAVGARTHPDHWLIDSVQAKAYDRIADDEEDGTKPDFSPVSDSQIPAHGAFKLSSWLLLTEQIFMNSDTSKSQNNWLLHAAQDEVPALTQEAVSNFYEILVYQLRKLIQTSIFCATSRIRSVRERDSSVRKLVKKNDVTTAIGLLGHPENPSQFWFNLARRNQLKVMDDRHRRGCGRSTILDYDQLETILIEAPRRGRRSTSRSSRSSSYLGNSDEVEKHDVTVRLDNTDAFVSSDSFNDISYGENVKPPGSPLQEDGETRVGQTNHDSENEEMSSATSNEEDLSTFDGDEDERLAIVDHANSRRHEIQLYHDLGWETSADLEVEDADERKAREELLQMTNHKSATDLLDWRDSIRNYREPWEEYGQCPEKLDFVENQRKAKRRKVEQDSRTTVDQDSRKKRQLPLRESYS